MNLPSATTQRDSERFQCAYVALSYVLDRRGAGLLARLNNPCSSSKVMVSNLGHMDRYHRAQALALGLAPIVESLDQRRLR
jgi:hypothetical protein